MQPAGSALSFVPAPSRGDAVRRIVTERVSALVAAAAARAWLSACRRVGDRPRALGRPLVRNGANVEIGDDVSIDSRGAPVELATVGAGRLVLGNRVALGPGCRLAATRYVELGDDVAIGAGCLVADDAPPGATAEDAAIWIGDGVTLGEGVRVAPGTLIGAGAVVEAGAVVSGVVPPSARVERRPAEPPAEARASAPRGAEAAG
jgi:acetyltransferase-like isoleucine patch superfamily enzyme